jgi:hypothetical protein
MSKLHEPEFLSKNNAFSRVAVPGGWVYRVWDVSMDGDNGYAALCFVPSPRAPHVRDARRLKLREGGTQNTHGDEDRWVTVWRGPDGPSAIVRHSAHLFTAIHADDSETDHATRLEAHDALVESGSPSPFDVVTGPAVKP